MDQILLNHGCCFNALHPNEWYEHTSHYMRWYLGKFNPKVIITNQYTINNQYQVSLMSKYWRNLSLTGSPKHHIVSGTLDKRLHNCQLTPWLNIHTHAHTHAHTHTKDYIPTISCRYVTALNHLIFHIICPSPVPITRQSQRLSLPCNMALRKQATGFTDQFSCTSKVYFVWHQFILISGNITMNHSDTAPLTSHTKHSLIIGCITVQCNYNAVNNIHKRHPIAHPLGWGIESFYGSSIWLIFCLSSSNYSCNILQYWNAL